MDSAGATGGVGGGAGGGGRSLNFIEQMIEADIAAGRWGLGSGAGAKKVHTRFPPEPNGFLHVGHAKSIFLNYGLARRYGGKFNLRFDDTNPLKEEMQYVEGIKRDVRWLTSHLGGSFDSGPCAGGMFWASDYFEQMEELAKELIKKGLAYVCQLSGEEVAARRGTPSVASTSPYRDRPVEESMRLFREMKAGKHADGSMTLRAKIDLASPNFNLRDPVMYRVLRATHHNTGDKWCIYPMYDWAHGIEDSLEEITHSICTLEFENHRPLYDWFMEAINLGRSGGSSVEARLGDGESTWGRRAWHSQQIEFAKLQLTYTVLSKRNLLKMVQEGMVDGWDDPRMPTLCGLRRRGVPPEAIALLCEEVGVTKVDSVIDIQRLEECTRKVLNASAARVMCVLDPVKVVIENWPAGVVEEVKMVGNPLEGGSVRSVPFSGTLWIEREDFMAEATPEFYRLAIGQEVRLRWAYWIVATRCETDASGRVTTIYATYDPTTKGGEAPVGADGKPSRKVKATIHWISADSGAASHASGDASGHASGHASIGGEVRLYERLFAHPSPGERTGSWVDDLTKDSKKVLRDVRLDPVLKSAKAGETFQFERLGYFTVDQDSGVDGRGLVLNRTITLKDGSEGAVKRESGGGGKGAGGGGGGGRMYTMAELALELKVKVEKVAGIVAAGGPADFASRAEKTITLSEMRALRTWLKANPGAGR
jgi:glutaminyl-tRNA synthetase